MFDSLPFAKHRNEIERQIIVLLVEDILAAGYSIAVDNGLEEQQGLCGATEVFAAMATTGRDTLVLRRDNYERGAIRLIYGNSSDVISNYTTSLHGKPFFERADALAARFRACSR